MDWPHALLWAKPENVERLARALGVELPPKHGEGYKKMLRRRVAQAIEKDRIMAEAEERRQAERAEQKRIAREIADALGETAPRPRRQIQRILALMGEEWTRDSAAIARAVHGAHDYAVAKTSDGAPRTLGGVFFAECRRKASARMKDGAITKRDYYRCFHDWPRGSREKKSKPAPKPKPVPVRRVETPVRQAQGKPKRQQTAPEVFVQRRRA